MIRPVDYALIADGSSDRALLPVIRWNLRRLEPERPFAFQGFASHQGSISAAIDAAVAKYRPDILFVHRDAEKVELAVRRSEIPARDDVVKIVPVRMTETWLLIDEHAIRTAAGNPNGEDALGCPGATQLETLAEPKKRLHELLLKASGAVGPRRKARFQRDSAALVHRVAEGITDFSVLLNLEAFRQFSRDLEVALERVPTSA